MRFQCRRWVLGACKTNTQHTQYLGWSSEVAALRMPVMIVCGEADGLLPAHAAQFFELLGGGKRDAGWDGSGMTRWRLAILPGITHYTSFASPALATSVIPFLDAPMPQAT
jgi:hypothetical protein